MYGEKFECLPIIKASVFVLSEGTEYVTTRWTEYLKDYEVAIQYHLGKTNVIADVLSQKSTSVIAYLIVREWRLLEQLSNLNAELKLMAQRSYYQV